MLVKKLSALCALACATLSGQAMAVLSATELAIVNEANLNGRVVFISGASAVQAGFTGIVSTLFQPGSIRFASTTGSSRDFEAVAGKLANAAGPALTDWPIGTNVIVIYRTRGGSVFGVNPVARIRPTDPLLGPGSGQPIDSLNVNSTCDTAPLDVSGTGTATLPYVCSVSLDSRVPDAGVSDVAPNLFHGTYNTEGGEVGGPNGGRPAAALTPEELGTPNLETFPIYGLAFGVPVTKNVGLVNLNKATISAILTGNVGTWDQVNSTQSGDIVICRRVPGSGTQAVFNMYFGNYPCNVDTAFNVPADRDASGAWNDLANTYTVTPNTGGLVVIENSTSGDVRNCLNRAVTGGSYTTRDREGDTVTVNFTATNNKAIGVLSMDSLSSSLIDGSGVDGIPGNADDATNTGNWQFRSLDGAGTITWNPGFSGAPVVSGTGRFPTLAEYETGDWDEQGWIHFNIPKRTTGPKRFFLDDFLTNARNPAILASINSLKFVAAGIPGGTFTGPQVLDAAYVSGNQCAPYNRNFND